MSAKEMEEDKVRNNMNVLISHYYVPEGRPHAKKSGHKLKNHFDRIFILILYDDIPWIHMRWPVISS